jgi:hypothetical protein
LDDRYIGAYMKQKEEDKTIYISGAKNIGEWNPGEPLFSGMIRNHPHKLDGEGVVCLKRQEGKKFFTRVPVDVHGNRWEEVEVKFV